ncbi:MAG: hypothetical protein EPO22_11085 [Dehalococcoidia bacterium]|nr:MAG: hypothetical protein EPO22_11085 [Dehalococcoidia bacterium]
MRPYPEEVVRVIQAGIAAHFAPELQTTYSQAQFAFSMILFGVVQRDFDTAVPDLIEDSRTLRELLAQVSSALDSVDATRAAAAREVIAGLAAPAASLRLSALRAENEGLRTAIGKLAPVIEPAADVPELAALRPARGAIFAHLLADAKRRIVPILTV